MATTVARLEAVLSAQTRDFDRAMQTSEGRMRRVGTAAGVAGAALGGALVLGLRAGWREMLQAQQVTAQTNAAIKSTGGVANVSAKQIDALATSLFKKSGVDDETIKSGANMLLTFTKIHNEAGRGNNIFDQATVATLNLSVAMGKDMTSSAILVGKALNDPVRGVTALTRAGVQLTEGQKAQIKAMVESGNVMGAQKIILKELETQFGGSADAAGKTLAGQLNIAKESFTEMMAVIVEAVLPAFVSFTEKMTAAITWLQEHPKVAKLVVAALGVLATALIAVRAATLAMNLAMLANPFGLVVLAIAALVAALVLAWQRSDTFKEKVKAAWETVQTFAGWISTAWEKLKDLFGWVKENAATLGGWLETAFRVTPLGVVVTNIPKVLGALKDLYAWVKENGAKVLAPLVTAFETLASFIKKVVEGIKWLIEKIPSLPKLPDINPFGGDVRDPSKTLPPQGPVGSGRMDISPKLWDELAGAQRFGLVLTSGYRPGAITASGTPSDHGVYPSKAIDVSGSSGAMARFFTWLIGQRDVKQAFYDPLGSIFGGILSSYREGGHSDHVHVATYDRGGYLRPGWNLAYNGLGRPEPVGAAGGPQTIIVQLGDTTLARLVRNAKGKFEKQNGPGSF